MSTNLATLTTDQLLQYAEYARMRRTALMNQTEVMTAKERQQRRDELSAIFELSRKISDVFALIVRRRR